MKRSIFTSIIIVLAIFTLQAQNWNEIYYMDTDAEYAIEEKKYDKAIEIYDKILRRVPESSLTRFKIGITYLKTDDQKEKAVPFLEEAIKDVAHDFDAKSISEIRAPIEAHLFLGVAYQNIGKIPEALNSYKNYKGLIDSGSQYYALVNQYIETCMNAEEQMKKPRRFKMSNLGDPINDKNSNINAVFSGDGNTVAFTSYTTNYIDLFIAKKTGESWGKPKNVSDQVSKKYYLKTTGITFDGNTLYLATDDVSENDIYESIFDGTKWTNAKKMDKVINTKSNETHASVSKDGNTIYFTSDRPGGMGGLDIYKSTKDEKGKWGPAVNLGSKINTPLNEETPFITLDGEYLFFSSQGHTSIGGYDIFYVNLNDDQEIINLGYPINSTGNDLFYVPGDNLQTGYLSRFDNASLGKNDIYKIELSQDILLKGKIIGQPEIAQMPYTILLLNKETKETVNSSISDQPEFEWNITPGDYLLSIVNENYNSFFQDISIPSGYSNPEFIIEANLIVKEEAKPEPEPVAENIEPIVEPQSEPEPIVAPKEELAVVTPVVEKEPEPLVEEPKEEPIIEEVKIVIEEPKPVEKPKETIKPAISFETSEGAEKSYSVQIMALKKPVDIDYFSNLHDVTATLSPDGFYRYTVGYTRSYAEISNLKEKINNLGYANAFVKINPFIANYTIQLMALKAPIDLNYFKDLTVVSVTKGADEYYRYTFGAYESIQKAKDDLQKLKELGYKQVFIKKIEPSNNLANN